MYNESFEIGWNKTEYEYNGRKILIMSKRKKGMKAHVFTPDREKVEFTLRYHFILPAQLLQKVKNKIDASTIKQ